MRLLICGASGFIGSHLAVALRAEGHEVVAAARRSREAARRLPGFDWIECDFRRDRARDWRARLHNIDAVINCVGVLQDGLGDNSRLAHVDGADALFAACEEAGIRRVVHISAAGADPEAGSGYSDDKLAGEAALKSRDLDWVILRPSLVVARNTYGGTTLIRALAGLPWLSPVVGAGQEFRPIMMPDLCAAVSECLEAPAPVRRSFDIGGRDRISMAGIVTAYRRWLGFGPTRIWPVPRWLARPAFWFGDALGWLGVRTSMRTNSLKQLDYDVAGEPEEWLASTRVQPQSLQAFLDGNPAGQADKWQARLGFTRPLARAVMGVFWVASGLIALTTGYAGALERLAEGGFSPLVSQAILLATSVFDIALGAAMLLKWRVRLIAGIMIAGTLGYIAALSLTLPQLWADPLGPIVKVFPMMALALILAATEDER